MPGMRLAEGHYEKRSTADTSPVATSQAFSPPILQTSFHSASVTGCTDRRPYFTSAMPLSFGSALIAASVTGFGSGLSATVVTATHGSPLAAVGSGIDSRVIVKTAVTDVENYLNAADLGLYTSDHESFGLSILESMVHGHPVLATRAGGVPEVMEDGVTGFMLDPGDVAGFVDRLDAIVEAPERYRSLGERGRLRARELFSADRIVGEYLDYYHEVLEA